MSQEGTSAKSAATAPPLLNDRYELGERLAEGTFFYTHRGRDTSTGRAVAIKVLKPEYAGDEAFTSRLLAEAQSAIHLRHANIAEVYEAWLERGTVVIITEWIRGINLKDRIRRVAPFPLAVAMDIMLACAEALNYAHQSGFVHGDVRPDNVIITPEGRVKLTDFGVGVGVAASTRIQLSALPQAASYMAPEVAEGRMPNAATDQYSLGCILFEMLAGTVPFTAESPVAIAVKHLHEPPPSVKKHNPGLPNAVEGIALKCMQKDPSDRYADLTRLLQDVQAVREALRSDKPLTWSPMDPPAESVPVAPKKKSRAAVHTRNERAQPVDPESGPSLKLLFGLAALACIMIFASFSIVAMMVRAPNTVTLPTDLVGKRQEDVSALLTKLHLLPEIRQEFHESLEPGKVFDTDPNGGTQLREGRPVIVYVSQGPQPVVVPSLIGKDLATAVKDIRAAGLAPGRPSEEFSEVSPKGQVISQSPAADEKVKKNTPVELTVSKGPEPFATPPPTPDTSAENGNTSGENGENGGENGGGNPPDTGTPPGGDTATETPTEPLIRDHIVTVKLSRRSQGPQRVKIIARDADGLEHEAYNEEHQPGDSFEQRVTTTGAVGKCQILIYVNDQLKQTITK